jgi:polyhydroxybutyrate depolymerase
MPKCLLKHTASRLLSSLLLISLMVGCSTPESKGEGTVRNLIRQRIRERSQQHNPTSPAGSNAAGEMHQLTDQGISRSYYLHMPSAAMASRTPLPLVIGLHGGRTDSDRFAKTTEFNSLADQEGFTMAYPAGVNRHWNDGRDSTNLSTQSDMAFISAMIDDIKRDHALDGRRIYATGISNGGFMAQRLACELSNKIAAVASVAATLAAPIAQQCHPNRSVPILMINSPVDGFVPWQGGTMTKGEGGTIVSVPDMVNFWRTNNRCSSQAIAQPLKATIQDGTAVTITRYAGAQSNSDVLFVKIDGGGHTWPGGAQQPAWLVGKTTQNLNATRFIWDFLKGHSL